MTADKRKRLQGAGMLFTFPPMDGPTLQDLLGEALPDAQDAEVQRVNKGLQPLVMETWSLEGICETPNVQQNHLAQLCRLVEGESWICQPLNGQGAATMASLGCAHGVVSADSRPDGYIFRRVAGGATAPVVGGVLECKGTVAATIDALRQAFAEATNVALAHRRSGVACKDVRVPVWSTTGLQAQFGVVRMLKPALPYLTVACRPLCLNDDRDLLMTARLLVATRRMCAEPLIFVPALRFAGHQLTLCLNDYHRKSIHDFSSVYPTKDQGLTHMLRLTNKLSRDARTSRFVVPPITMYEGEDGTWLLFPNLAPVFRIGMPDDQETRRRYVDAVREAATAFHVAGVAHLDLYPSNIMWRRHDNREVEVKVIDWDSAHELNSRLTQDTLMRLQESPRAPLCGAAPYTAGAVWDDKLVDVLAYAATHEGWTLALRSSVKEILDTQFRLCTHEYVAQMRGGGGGGDDNEEGDREDIFFDEDEGNVPVNSSDGGDGGANEEVDQATLKKCKLETQLK
jgi:hypothetical protein